MKENYSSINHISMKKSFTLKAFAFGAAASVALTASATPHEFLKANNEPVAVKADFKQEAPAPIRMSAKQLDSNASKAPAQKAEPSYGGWDQSGEGTYTFVQMTSKKVNYNYQRCEDTANPGNFKVKVADWGKGLFSNTGTELEFTVAKTSFLFGEETEETMAPTLPAGGVPTGHKATGYPDGQAHDVYLFDRVSWMKALQAAGETWDDGTPITDAQCEQWYALYDFDDVSGKLTYFPIYCLVVDNKPTWFTFPSSSGSGASTVYYTESYQMKGNGYKNYDLDLNISAGYFSHEKDATTGTFNFTYDINDNNEVWFQILTGKKTGSALQSAMQELLKKAYNNDLSDGIVKLTASSGEVNVPVSSYRKGQYTLLCAARYPGIEEGYFLTKSNNTLRLLQEDVDFYSAGMASYTDATMYDALPVVFGAESYEELCAMFMSELQITLPEVYTVTVPMQANSANEGEYRLVHPYMEYFNNYLSQSLEYDIMSDFLMFNVADPNKSFISPSATGIYFPTKSSGEIMMVYGSTNKMQGGSLASADVWGTLANGTLSFPEVVVPDGATSLDEGIAPLGWSQASFSSESGAITYKNHTNPVVSPEICKIVSDGFAGIENVAADAEFDANAPVEYFNLQGIRVATPEAGQLLIKRQGNKATKVIIR